ncbi:MAG: class I SAM-dependent methyltransferase [Myxococcales bacterium]|nr:class I SAM-dependent methyltransferase [Myxococcales bacterium]
MQSLRERVEEVVAGLDIAEWMGRWRHMQGGTDRERLIRQLVAILPNERSPRVLDLCCGPGDVGRAVRARFPEAQVDHVDRDEFFLALCRAVNQREGLTHRVVRGDLWTSAWRAECPGPYDAALLANALHWFNDRRLLEILGEVRESLAPGGMFAFLEPASPIADLAAPHAAWLAAELPGASDQFNRDWADFWQRLDEAMGYEYYENVVAGLPPGEEFGAEDGLHVTKFVDLLREAGFREVDILARDAFSVVIAALR